MAWFELAVSRSPEWPRVASGATRVYFPLSTPLRFAEDDDCLLAAGLVEFRYIRHGNLPLEHQRPISALSCASSSAVPKAIIEMARLSAFVVLAFG